jgi:FMN-dependent oxidoreductase (nitrilotriacetate monooxygenase family)
MPKQIRLNALDMGCVGFLAQGLWRHAADRSTDYCRMSYWLDYARLLERGLFDALFLADTIGVYDVYGGGKDAAVRRAVQVPSLDPWMLVPAMAAVTSGLSFGVTGNVLYEPPYLFARRLSTLDHLSDGRLAWNIVTGILASGARAMGRGGLMGHDERYDAAQEYLEIVYRLWEGSWADDAVLRDREAGLYADPAKVAEIDVRGRHFSLTGAHMSEPSPQRTPVLFQAGASGRGRAFAARHAECIFVNGPTPASVAKVIADTRAQAVAFGRRADDIRFFAGASFIVGRTEAEARARYEQYCRLAAPEAVLAHLSGSLGIDLAQYPLDEPIRYQENDANRSAMEALTVRAGRSYTVRQVVEEMAVSARNLLVVGDPGQVADTMVRWSEEGGIDGFNIGRLAMPDDLEAFIDLVIPELQRRGVYKTAYAPGTLREKLGGGARLPASHPAAACRQSVGSPGRKSGTCS